MTDKIIPLIYLLGLGFIAYRLCNSVLPEDEQFGNRHIAFVLILYVTGFLITYLLPAPYAVFLLTSIISMVVLTPLEPVRRIAMFFFLCPLMPSLDWDLHIGIPLMWMTWLRLLTIVLLLPLLAGALRRRALFDNPIDKYVWAFVVLSAALAFRDTSFTNGLRGATYVVIDILAPYIVLSRYLDSFADIRKVLFPLFGALVFAAMVNVFETARTWHLYEQLMININGARFMAIERLGLLRATGPFSVPSRAGFALAAALGLCWALSPHLRNRKLVIAIVAILTAGLFVTFSRGNWIGGAIIGMCFLFTVNRKQFVRLTAVLMVGGLTLSYFDFTDQVVRVLPFIGDQESEAAGTVSYRQELLQTSLRVAAENPWFGSRDFHRHPDMEAIRQSSGLLDLVNHYLIILLNTGYTGLTLFLLILLSTFKSFVSALRNANGMADDERILCKALMFSLLGLLVAITTTSALGRVGLIIWTVVAIAAVLNRILQPARSGARQLRPSARFADTREPATSLRALPEKSPNA